jgi:hypothetical protein
VAAFRTKNGPLGLQNTRFLTFFSLFNNNLAWSDPRDHCHLGDHPWFEVLPNAETITIDHLLRHSAGLPDQVHRSRSG